MRGREGGREGGRHLSCGTTSETKDSLVHFYTRFQALLPQLSLKQEQDQFGTISSCC